MSTPKKDPTRVLTGKVRFSYTHVFEMTSMNEDGSNAKYSTAIIIPKTDTAAIAKIEAAIKAAEAIALKELGGKLPKNFKYPLRDGDEEREDDPTYANSYFLNASTTRKPEIVDADLEKIMSKDEFYSGCYGRATLNFYFFNVSGNKGIAAGLGNLQKLEDGERLGGSYSSAEDDFADDDDSLL